MRAAHYFFAALFGFAVLVQYNDPDPGRWMAIYGAAALVCFMAARRIGGARAFRVAPALVGAAALGWAAGIWLGIEHPLMPWRMFERWEMKDVAVEETRETFGLLIVAGWMAVTAITAGTGSRGSAGSTGSGSTGP